MSDAAPSIPLTMDPGPRALGDSELRVGPIAYGCWRLADGDAAQAEVNIRTALDVGFTLVDTADIYGWDGSSGFGAAETLLGQVLAASPRLREQMVLATKGGIRPGVPYDWSGPYLREACEASLRRLGVEVIDLYQLHRPDVLTHPAEVAGALTELLDRGLVREVGLSNVTVPQFELVQAHLDRPIVATQPEFSIWHSEPVRDGTFDHALTQRVTPLAWSPLGGGRIGSIADDRVRDPLERLAREHDTTTVAVALAFVLAHPASAIPILGTQRAERITAARAALDVQLTRAEWYSLYQAGTGEALP